MSLNTYMTHTYIQRVYIYIIYRLMWGAFRCIQLDVSSGKVSSRKLPMLEKSVAPWEIHGKPRSKRRFEGENRKKGASSSDDVAGQLPKIFQNHVLL